MSEHALIQILRNRMATQPAPADGPEAAVLIPVMLGPEPQVLLTRRPAHMNSHAGEVAFPGGKRDREDDSLVATALRESREEVSLASAHVEIIGALAPARAKSGIRVLPVVGLVHGDPELTANPDEVESIFRVPLQFFMEHAPARDHRINFRGIDLVVPCFRYQGFIIWGLTAYMLVEFMRQGFDHHIDYPWPPILPGILVPATKTPA
jgi:8-oxo-dGTP pyrophosphatase MutT (NUDIX family)